MEYDLEEALAQLAGAITQFLKETKLGKTGAGEVAATFELGWYIRNEFHPEWDVHGEYDRLMGDEKFLGQYRPQDNTGGGVIRPDIIVHHVNTMENLLFIEAKLEGGSFTEDHWKLRGVTRDPSYRYALGVHLVFVLNDVSCFVDDCSVFTGGTLNHELTGLLRDFLGVAPGDGLTP